MKLEIWKPWFRLAFLELGIWEYILLALYALSVVVLLIRSRRDFLRLNRGRLLSFIGLVAGALLLNHILVLDLPSPDLLPPPNIPLAAPELLVRLLGMLPVFVAGAFLGSGPALLVGLASGILRADMTVSGIAEPLHLALYGYAIGFVLRQDYRGRLPLLARQPLVAALVLTPFAKLLALLAVYAHVANAGLAGIDYALTLTRASLLPALLESLIAAGILQAIFVLLPRLRPVKEAQRPSPHSRSLNLRLVFVFLPLLLMMTWGLIQIVTTTTLRMATSEAMSEVARDAASAAEEIPFFIHTGQGLLAEFANDERLQSSDPATIEQLLKSDLHTIVFFDQLVLFGADGQIVAMYPPAPAGNPTLTDEEERLLRRVLADGAPQVSSAHPSSRDEPHLAFLTPVGATPGLGSSGALLGRTRLDINPTLNRILASVQWTQGRGEGFVVSLDGHIVSHSDSRRLLQEWHLDESCAPTAGVPHGCFYEGRDPACNTRQLVYYLPAEGHPWAVVISIPYEVVMEKAQEVATPLLVLQVLFGGGLMIVIPLVTSVMTRPLKQLAVAADRIAEGNLARPVHVSGDDEVGRVGSAFESMRIRLRDQMEDLSLLLETSEAVAATLELSTGMPSILEGTLKATRAQVARIILLTADGESQMVMSRGTPSTGLEDLDRSLVAAVKERKAPMAVENLMRARTLADSKHNKPIKAAVALPVYSKQQMTAVMWAGYGDVRYFDEHEIDLLSTLASQTAVLVENARLFQAAEGGRQQLSAILDSTTDAVLVIDREDHIVLVNPAAEQAFGVAAQQVSGRELDQADLPPALVDTLKDLSLPDDARTEEIPLSDGRTLYANVSTLMNDDGEQIGRVTVMHDITRFKELDELKSEFLATVSHDLRTPLMFMRGYASMLPAVGALSEKQEDYVEKILQGVAQINDMVSDLLDLGRIEAGVGIKHEPCHLIGVLVEAVDLMRGQAAAKGIELTSESSERNVTVDGDAALLRRAVTNLIENAIKYTPDGGAVTVELSARQNGEGKQAMISISDTGLGIAPEDQVRLFEKFYRIKRSDMPDVKGTGLGLAIVKSVVERHGGKVWVESELDRGSTFYVSLPMSNGGSKSPQETILIG
jgi:PAS domain S-box-containing protein